MENVRKRTRAVLSKDLQVVIFRRDGWLCCWCKKPVIFGPVMKYLERELKNAGHDRRLAYYHLHWTRDGSPLLDELGAVIDHVAPFFGGGLDNKENLITACNKCNGHKSAATVDRWSKRHMHKPIKGKYGEPQNWDGLSALFVLLASRNSAGMTASEKGWLKALRETEK